MTRDRIAARLGMAVCLVAVLMVAAHLVPAARSLDGQRQRNERYDALGHAIAAADTLNIDNPWVAAAYQLLPADATYAVVGPPAQMVTDGRVSEVTYDGVAPYMRYLLLPRVPVSVPKAEWILCYGCGRRFAGIHWLWSGGDGSKIPGLLIGRRGGAR